mgnify:CR=1 FL=1
MHDITEPSSYSLNTISPGNNILFLRDGALSLGDKVSPAWCITDTSSWVALSAGFPSYSRIAPHFRCITAYKQPPPSLHRIRFKVHSGINLFLVRIWNSCWQYWTSMTLPVIIQPDTRIITQLNLARHI